jgi:hypothetical protein
MHLFENTTVLRVLGGGLIVAALISLIAGKAIVPHRYSRYSRRPLEIASRAEDPVSFYFEIVVLAGLGGLFLYKSRGA